MKKMILIVFALLLALAACGQATHYDGVTIGLNGTLVDSAKVVGEHYIFYSSGNAYLASPATFLQDSAWDAITTNDISTKEFNDPLLVHSDITLDAGRKLILRDDVYLNSDAGSRFGFNVNGDNILYYSASGTIMAIDAYLTMRAGKWLSFEDNTMRIFRNGFDLMFQDPNNLAHSLSSILAAADSTWESIISPIVYGLGDTRLVLGANDGRLVGNVAGLETYIGLNYGQYVFMRAYATATLDDATITVLPSDIRLEIDNQGTHGGYFYMNSTGFLLHDYGGRGLQGMAYYGASAQNNDYVQKYYVDQAIIAGGGSSYLAGTGMTLTGNVFHWGGDLTQDAIVTNAGTYETRLRTYHTANDVSSYVLLENGNIYMNAYENDSWNSTNSAQFSLQNAQFSIAYNGAIESRAFYVNSTGIIIYDGIGSKGMTYNSDYKALGTLDPLWVPNWGAVTDAIASSGGLWTSNSPDIYFNTGDVGIGVITPTGALDVVSTTGAFLPPRMTTAQRLALTLINGSMVFDSDIGAHFVYRDGAWGQLSSGTPVSGGDIILLKTDWRSFPFGLGNANAVDTTLMVVTAEMGVKEITADTIVPEQIKIWCEGTSGTVTVQIYHGTDPTAAGTAVLTTAYNISTIDGLETSTSFDVLTIPKGHFIWAEITVVSEGTKPTKIRLSFSYSYQ